MGWAELPYVTSTRTRPHLCGHEVHTTVPDFHATVQRAGVGENAPKRSCVSVRFCTDTTLLISGLKRRDSAYGASAARAFGSLTKDMNDEARAVFLGRIDFFKANLPGADWDGIFLLAVK